jgi:hypothetical protein
MNFWGGLFNKKKKAESIVLVNIGADRVSGAYAHYETGKQPTLLYTRHLPLELRPDEKHETAMLRALSILAADLIREGAPVVGQLIGQTTLRMILVSIDAPWQETTVHTVSFEQKEPFTFTKKLIEDKLKERGGVSATKSITDESIIGTILNGYETKNPYGKKVRRASAIVLTSLIERAVADAIIDELRKLFRVREIVPIAGNSLRYQTIRDLFPHERDLLMIDATGGGALTSIALVRKGIFSIMTHISTPMSQESWVTDVSRACAEIASTYPLPRTIFLLARDSELPQLQQKISAASMAKLWLTDSPPNLIPVSSDATAHVVRYMSDHAPDIVLLLMAFYYERRRFLLEEEESERVEKVTAQE